MKKRILIFSTLILIVTLPIVCRSNSIQINNNSVRECSIEVNTKNMDEVISDYIIKNTKYKPTEMQFEAHRIYAIEEKDNKIKVYLCSSLAGFSFIDNFFKLEAGGDHVVLIVLTKKDENYEVISFRHSLTNDDIVDMFPKEYRERALNENYKELCQEVKRKAEEWLKSQGRTEKIKDFGP